MTCYPFWKKIHKSIEHWYCRRWTKASTGYTFKNSDKYSTQLVKFLEQGRNLKKFHHKTKFWYYDLLLLDILDRKTNFLAFFLDVRRGESSAHFKFLDEETSTSRGYSLF
jgi:lycopene beta-cyclase